MPIPVLRRPFTLLAALLSLAALSACVSDGELGARDDAVCTGRGLQPGTAEYTSCRTLLSNQHRDDALVARSEYFSEL